MILHHYPVWKEEAHLAVMARVETSSGQAIEQLWARKVTHDSHVLCCVPAYTRDLRLGDLVEVDEDFFITRVLKPSERHLIRILFKTDDVDGRRRLHTGLHDSGALVEVIDDSYWVVDVCCSEVLSGVTESLESVDYVDLIKWKIVD